MLKRLLIVAGLLFAASALWAGPVFVGSFNVYDGPVWTSNPPAMSAREVAAMLFGGVFTDYAISVDPSLDPTTITHTAHLDGYGDTTYLVSTASEDFKLSSRPDGGYDSWPSFSAWVCDHADCVDYGFPETIGWPGLNYTNYVWRLEEVIPEPSTWLMIGAGLGALGLLRRKRS